VLNEGFSPTLEASLVDENTSPDDGEENIIKEALESRNIGIIDRKQLGQGIGASDAQSQDLPEHQDDPELFGIHEAKEGAVPIDRTSGWIIDNLRGPRRLLVAHICRIDIGARIFGEL